MSARLSLSAQRLNRYLRDKGRWPKGIPGPVDKLDLEMLLALHGEECFYCGIELSFFGEARNGTWDHFIPLALGGSHSRRNLVPACHSCNNKKGEKVVTWERTAMGTGRLAFRWAKGEWVRSSRQSYSFHSVRGWGTPSPIEKRKQNDNHHLLPRYRVA